MSDSPRRGGDRRSIEARLARIEKAIGDETTNREDSDVHTEEQFDRIDERMTKIEIRVGEYEAAVDSHERRLRWLERRDKSGK